MLWNAMQDGRYSEAEFQASLRGINLKPLNRAQKWDKETDDQLTSLAEQKLAEMKNGNRK